MNPNPLTGPAGFRAPLAHTHTHALTHSHTHTLTHSHIHTLTSESAIAWFGVEGSGFGVWGSGFSFGA